MKFKVGDKVVLNEVGICGNLENLQGVCEVIEVDESVLPYRVKDGHGEECWFYPKELEYAVEAQASVENFADVDSPKIDLATMEYVARSLVAISSAAVNDTERLAAFSGYISGLLAGLKGDIPA